MESASDIVLMDRARNGDDAAFAELIDRYKDSLINYLRHLTRSHDRAEEIAHDAFVGLYRTRTRWKCDSLGPYLFRIATNELISQIRRERRWRLLLPMLVATPREPERADRAAFASEIQRKVHEALEALPVKLRAPLVLYEIEEWSYDDIARALGCRAGTVKSRIFRARAQMRKQLQPWWSGGNDERCGDWKCDAADAARERVASIRG